LVNSGEGEHSEDRSRLCSEHASQQGAGLDLAAPAEALAARSIAALADPLHRLAVHAASSLCLCGRRDPGETSMADADDVRRLALSLPHVTEVESEGFDFRVGNKGFVWSYPERQPGKPRRIRTDVAVLFVGDETEKWALLLGEPDIFFTTPGYDGWPLVMLRLPEVDLERLRELVVDAWRMRAPDALAGDFD